jgi:hypothetical protein
VAGRWDPHGRSVGPACQVGPDRWDPRVRLGRRVGPTCKVGLKKFKCMTGGTRMAGRARQVGPTCQDGLKKFKYMAGGSYTNIPSAAT